MTSTALFYAEALQQIQEMPKALNTHYSENLKDEQFKVMERFVQRLLQNWEFELWEFGNLGI